MKNYLIPIVLLMVLALIPGCSSTSETQNTGGNNDSLYVFDEIPQDTSAKQLEITPIAKVDPPVTPVPAVVEQLYYVQIGAFSTEEKAQVFIEFAKKKVKKEMKLFYSPKLKLHIIQLLPGFSTKAEAEAYRNELWKVKEFKDAWVTGSEE